jgi:putative hydrolase of the HAD superfamily
MPLKAVIFDLDCTLTCRRSTMTTAAKQLSDLYADHLHPESLPVLEAAMRAADHFGYRPRREFFAEVFAAGCWRSTPTVESALDWWTHRFGQCNVLHEQVLPLLAEIRRRGLKLGMITNGPAVTQNAKLKQVGIVPLFDHIVIGGDFGKEKPDVSIFRHSCQSLGVALNEAVYVGDHAHNDITGAEAAGLHAIWITTGGPWPLDLPPPDRQIECLADLPAVLDTI